MMNYKAYVAEAIGTFWLTFGGCGSAVIAAGFPASRHRPSRRGARLRADRGDDGLRHRPYFRLPSQPGRHRRACGRRPLSRGADHALCHCAGDRRHRGGAAAVCDRQRHSGFRSSPADLRPTATATFARQILPVSALLMEVVMTMLFLFVIMGSTHGKAPAGFAPLAIGLA